MNMSYPKVGDWYQFGVQTNKVIEVVAVDRRFGVITTQCVDGELDEIDAEQWRDLEPYHADMNDWARVTYFTELTDMEEQQETEWQAAEQQYQLQQDQNFKLH